MNRSIPLLSLTTLLLVGNASAQLPDWGSLPSAAPTMVFAEASIVVVEDALGIHAWSSYSRAWADLSVSAGAQFYGYDDHCVVLDGTMAWGFATRAGKWQPQPVTAGASMSSSATGALWLSAVLDGNDVHTFSGLSGAWHTSQFAAAPTVAVARMVAVLSDGVRTVGISAHFGEPVELGPVGSVQLDAVGYCGIARSATACHVFGAYRNSWRTLPATAAATIVKPPSRAGYVVVREPGYMNFYSALTDNQVLLLADASATLSTQANVAAVQVGNTIFAYSCSAGSVDAVTTASGWTAVAAEQELIVATDANAVHAFGMLVGQFAPPLVGSHYVETDAGVALALSLQNGSYEAFSCMSNTWVPAPTGSLTGGYVTYNTAVLSDVSGTLHGFSANRATWTTQSAPAGGSYTFHKAAFCAQSGNRLDAFNGRTGAWATTQTAAPAIVTCFDMAVMADDGQNLYCYSCYTSEWSSTPCAAVQQQLRDECAYGYDGATMHVWSGSCQVSEWANMPEYWRILARGGRASYTIAGFPGELAVLALSTAAADVPSPWGTVRIDPNGAFLVPVLVPPVGTGNVSFTIPDSVALRGLTLFAQGLIYSPAAADWYLTDYFESTIM